jgi:Protein of unknown function (DUF4231)
MSTSEQIEYLKKNLEDQINAFKKRRRENRRLSVALRVLIISLGGLITVLLGVKVDAALQQSLNNLALICGAAISLATAIESFFNYRELYVRYTTTYVQLLNLKSDLEFQLIGENNRAQKQEIEKLFTRFQQILTETNEYWQQAKISEGKR